jgi:hypothetical protein
MERTTGRSEAAPSYPVMTIYAHETLPPGIIAKLDGSQLFVDPSATGAATRRRSPTPCTLCAPPGRTRGR